MFRHLSFVGTKTFVQIIEYLMLNHIHETKGLSRGVSEIPNGVSYAGGAEASYTRCSNEIRVLSLSG